ncbi:MAG: alpha/beta fold hydrolase [Gemmataceae bacterium]
MPAALVFLLPVLLAAGPPRPPDRADLLSYRDDRGERRAVRTPADWPKRVAQIHAGMEAVMGPLPPPTDLPLDVRVTGETPLRLYTRRHLTFVTEKGDRLPAYLLIPHGGAGKHPAVVCLPGSSPPGKDVPAGLTPDLDRAYAHELAERGYVCLVLDYPVRHTREYATDPAALGYVSTTMKGIVNHRRGVDLLRALPFVDGDAIGVIGHSLGGHNALVLAAFDPRVRAVVSSCGFNTFAKYMRGNLAGWSSKYYMPRIKTVYGDDPAHAVRLPEVLAAIAPATRVFVNAPRHDDNFEVSGVRDCVAAACRCTGCSARRSAAGRVPRRRPHLPRRPANCRLRLPRPAFASVVRPPPRRRRRQPISPLPWRSTSPSRPRWRWTCLVNRYDPAHRRGFHLTLKTATGVTSNQPNRRHLQFGIDADRASAWEDCRRPGARCSRSGLATHAGHLYAGTCEPGKDERGHVYRYVGGRTWIDCGAPDRCNAVTALGSHDGRLYAGTGRYRLAGSALASRRTGTSAAASSATRAAPAGPTAASCPTPRRSAGW